MTSLLPAILLSLAVNATAAISISDPGQDVFDFTADATELSGLTWLTGHTYHGVSDATNQRWIGELDIGADPASGRITAASLVGPLTLAAGYDLEGIAWCLPRGTWFVSDEGQHPHGGFLREHTLPDGRLLRTLPTPPPLANNRPNFGFESCTWGAGALWTANEEALGGEPTATDPSPLLQCATDHGALALVFTRHLTRNDFTLTVQAADTPDGPWSDLARSIGANPMTALRERVQITETGTGATRRTAVSELYPPGDPSQTRRFMRLTASHPN